MKKKISAVLLAVRDVFTLKRHPKQDIVIRVSVNFTSDIFGVS